MNIHVPSHTKPIFISTIFTWTAVASFPDSPPGLGWQIKHSALKILKHEPLSHQHAFKMKVRIHPPDNAVARHRSRHADLTSVYICPRQGAHRRRAFGRDSPKRLSKDSSQGMCQQSQVLNMMEITWNYNMYQYLLSPASSNFSHHPNNIRILIATKRC